MGNVYIMWKKYCCHPAAVLSVSGDTDAEPSLQVSTGSEMA